MYGISSHEVISILKCQRLYKSQPKLITPGSPQFLGSEFDGSFQIMSDNRTESRSKLFTMIAEELGVGHRVYNFSYHLQSSRRIEGFMNS